MAEDTRKLIPMGIKHCGDGKWLISIDGAESYSVKGDIDSVKRALRKFKAKDGDGDKHCRSSKNGTYKSMISDEDNEIHNINVWKSKVPHTSEEFKKLMEKNNTVTLTKNYLIEGRIVPKGTVLKIKEEEIKFLPTDIWNKAKDLKGDARFDYIKKEIGDKYSDDEIKSFISKNLKEARKVKYNHLTESVTNLGDLIDLLDDELHLGDYDFSEDKIDKIIDWAVNDDKVIKYWNKMEGLDIDDKAFDKTEQMLWNHIDNNINKIA